MKAFEFCCVQFISVDLLQFVVGRGKSDESTVRLSLEANGAGGGYQLIRGRLSCFVDLSGEQRYAPTEVRRALKH